MPSKTIDLEQLRYPVGRFSFPAGEAPAKRGEWIGKLREFPQQLKKLVGKSTDAHLTTPYRTGGWTVRQVIHHLADSHLNAYIRFKLGLTEERPTIKPYEEQEWAKLADSQKTPIAVSVALLEALHARWSILLESFDETDWQRAVFHPELKREISLDELLALYAWHGDHHLAHIRLVVG